MNWDEIGILISQFPYFNLRRLSNGLWQCQCRFCGNSFDHITSREGNSVCQCIFATGDDPREAILLAGKKLGIEM